MIKPVRNGRVFFKEPTSESLDEIIKKLRKSDKKEAWNSWRLGADEVVTMSVDSAEEAYVIELEGKPVGVFGVTKLSAFSRTGIIWLLGTSCLDQIEMTLARETRPIVDTFLKKYSPLVNWVDAENIQSIKWLKVNGFHIEESQPYGVYNKKFNYVWKKR